LFNIHFSLSYSRGNGCSGVPDCKILCREFYARTRPLTHILGRYARLSTTPAANGTQYENDVPYNALDPHEGFCIFFFLLYIIYIYYNHLKLPSFDHTRRYSWLVICHEQYSPSSREQRILPKYYHTSKKNSLKKKSITLVWGVEWLWLPNIYIFDLFNIKNYVYFKHIIRSLNNYLKSYI